MDQSTNLALMLLPGIPWAACGDETGIAHDEALVSLFDIICESLWAVGARECMEALDKNLSSAPDASGADLIIFAGLAADGFPCQGRLRWASMV